MNFQQLHCFQNVRNDCGLVLTGYEVYTDRFTQDGIRRSLYRSLSAIVTQKMVTCEISVP